MFKRVPLKIDCSGLTAVSVSELADALSLYFHEVTIAGGDTIYAANPISEFGYGRAWDILDRYGVRVY